MKEVAIAPRARAVQPTLAWEGPRSAYPVRGSRWNVDPGPSLWTEGMAR
jgi:hypothetical protein